MLKHNRWHDGIIDAGLFLQLQDLTTILTMVEDFQFEYSYGSYVDIKNRRITGSTLWDATKQHIQTVGYKTDVFLRAIGTFHETDIQAFKTFWPEIKETGLTEFATQLVTLLEDLRLENLIRHMRPGTRKDFSVRKNYLKSYFTSQMTMNRTRGFLLDELFCMIYLLLHADGPNQSFENAHEKQINNLSFIQENIYESFEAKTTADIVQIVIKIVWKLHNQFQDMNNIYFSFPISEWKDSYVRNTLFDELTRTDDVVNHDAEEVDHENNEYIDETFSTWHRENKNRDQKQMFLQMDLEAGTKTNLKGGGARETESGDQAFTTAEGTSGKTNQQDYSKQETIDRYESKKAGKQKETPYGEDNIDAIAIKKEANPPTEAEQLLYEQFSTAIDPIKRRLSQTIEKMLEHKQTESRQNLHFGRLSKNLLPIVTEEFPRLFYQKNEETNEFDAVFTLMVDCSASMQQKMDETKLGIVLFHEVLKQLKIPHSIVGFWEEATTQFDDQQPNYFHRIHSFSDSLYEKNGAKIMQLEAEEDNRDGFSIRIMSEELMTRREKHKFLLVFSDGEPAAANYNENGIVDTNIAVTEARKKGIQVVGMFLSDGEIEEQDDLMMKNIYGRERLMIPNVSDLPEYFAPVLKKLLLNTI